MNPEELSENIKAKAKELGFFSCGIAEAGFLMDHEPRLKKWLSSDHNGTMDWMGRNLDKRLDPSKLIEQARSVIVVLMNYFPETSLHEEAHFLISRYAYGKDYHFVIKEKLRKLQDYLHQSLESVQSRVFTDSAPVLERAWAVKAGLGWIGKNSMLITPRNGSYFFIGEIITDAVLKYDSPYGGSYCGDCSLCIQACPTKAIGPNRMIDSRRCISYLTIEKRGSLPEEFRGKYKQWIFGCDICQEVCPWNRFSSPHNEEPFNTPEEVKSWDAEKWGNMSKEDFNQFFGKSALMRTKYEGMKRNIAFLQIPEAGEEKS